MSPRGLRALAAAATAAACLAGSAGVALAAEEAPAALRECHIAGFRNGVLCGSVRRPLAPGQA